MKRFVRTALAAICLFALPTSALAVPFTLTGTLNGRRFGEAETTTLFVVGSGEMTYTYSTFFHGVNHLPVRFTPAP